VPKMWPDPDRFMLQLKKVTSKALPADSMANHKWYRHRNDGTQTKQCCKL